MNAVTRFAICDINSCMGSQASASASATARIRTMRLRTITDGQSKMRTENHPPSGRRDELEDMRFLFASFVSSREKENCTRPMEVTPIRDGLTRRREAAKGKKR